MVQETNTKIIYKHTIIKGSPDETECNTGYLNNIILGEHGPQLCGIFLLFPRAINNYPHSVRSPFISSIFITWIPRG